MFTHNISKNIKLPTQLDDTTVINNRREVVSPNADKLRLKFKLSRLEFAPNLTLKDGVDLCREELSSHHPQATVNKFSSSNLVGQWLMAKIASDGKVDYQRYFTHTDQIENLAFSDNIWATKLTYLANIYHICSSDSFPQTIQAIFNRLRESKQNRRLGFMLLPSNLPSPHVLGIELKIKEKHSAIYYTINLYNPHATNTHIHLEGLAKDIPHLINSLKFKQNFLTNVHYECNQVDCFIVAECHNLFPIAQDIPLNDNVNITSYSNIKPEDELFIRLRHGLISKSFLDQLELAKNIHTYLRLGMGGYRFLYHAILNHNLDFVEYCTKIFQYVPARYDANCKTFLAATGKNGQPALYAIFTRNQPQILKSYTKLLFQSQLPHYEITEIIAAANSKRYPGLFEAFRLNNLDVVLEYYNQVLESSLSQPQIVRLLVADSALNPSQTEGTLNKEHTTKYATGLEVAFLVGNQRLVELVTELVLDSLLDDQAMVAILNAIGNGSAPGLHSAFKANQESVIQAYFHLILDSSLSENHMAKLIIAEDIDGNSAFSIIFSHNNINLFQQVYPIIIQASIQERLKEQILLATSGKTPSLHLAFQNKNFNLIKEYFWQISHSNLSELTKQRLLIAEDENNSSALFTIFGIEFLALLEDVYSFILDLELSEEIKVAVLSAKRHGKFPGLYESIWLGDEENEVVEAICKLILNSKLSETAKLTLLIAHDNAGTAGLHRAFAQGKIETIKLFYQLVIKSNLSEAIKIALLTAKNASGAPGLYVAFDQQHNSLITVVYELIINSNLSSQAQLQLLMAMNPIGKPGLHLAFINGNSSLVERVCAIVLQSNLPPDIQHTLVMSKDSNGRLGAFEAIANHHSQCINAYAKVLKQHNFDVTLYN